MSNFLPPASDGQFSSSQTYPPTLVGPQNTQTTTDQRVMDADLPARPTCPMPYYPDPEILDRDEHSGSTGGRYYVCIPARVQGVFTSESRANAMVRGWRNGHAQSVQTYEEARLEWATNCHRWHGRTCKDASKRSPVTMPTRIRLNPALLPGKWAIRGCSDLFFSRQQAFAAAEALHLKEIHILGSSNLLELEAWQYDEPSDE
ncbi:hypothetical protein B0H16DRAFT_1724547 [Mycena metata]|uniref:Uncharacterized protein n=1 Tax=Mycena metata TaxID=1033252 RepID=A0AAD7IUA1_9AGAR|nr:hypothetical protein B0H16DRAFT_1724547 [Mycena metata]